MFYTMYWADEGSAQRNADVLSAMLASLAAFGGARLLTVVALNAPDGHWGDIMRHVKDEGAAALDARSLLDEVSHAYPRIVGHHPPFEVACFLRWPVLARVIREVPFRQMWHIDSDMLFYASLEELARDTAGKTFILQGCPAFASIADPAWLDTYERALGALEESGEPGFPVTSEMRARHRNRDAALGNASVYRIPPASDQDLIECLVGEGRLPQDPFHVVSGKRFYYMQNPLCLRAWHHLVAGDEAAVFEERGGGIWFGERRVPFIHFQADAARYFQAHRRAASFGLERWLPYPMANPRDHASGRSSRYALAARLLAPAAQVDRGAIMRSYLATAHGDGLAALTKALNHLFGRRGT